MWRGKIESRNWKREKGKRERKSGEEQERFLSARADAFAGAKAEEKVGSLRSK
jgi:hypothetical protein